MTADRLSYSELTAIVAEECYLRAERSRHYGTDLPTGDEGRAMALRHRRTVEWPRYSRLRMMRRLGRAA